jgi:tRNA nucleotidyltransferase (CCA-adding enzyme)
VALARTERKSAPGYHGFTFHAAPEVTLEQDLARRDLTINAIAQAEDGRWSTPSAASATCARVLRHVSDAFVEDPVRCCGWRAWRRAFRDFTVAPETMALMRQMVANGEVDALVPERVWQELSRGLMAPAQPHVRGAARLRRAGAAAARVDRLWGVPQPPRAPPRGRHRRAPDAGAGHCARCCTRRCRCAGPAWCTTWARAARRAIMAAPPGPRRPQRQAGRPLAERLRVPTDCRELADVVAREHGNVHRSGELGRRRCCACSSAAMRCAGRPVFTDVLQACECDARIGQDPRHRVAAVSDRADDAVDGVHLESHLGAQDVVGQCLVKAAVQHQRR